MKKAVSLQLDETLLREIDKARGGTSRNQWFARAADRVLHAPIDQPPFQRAPSGVRPSPKQHLPRCACSMCDPKGNKRA
jgi:hypothetical protein